MLSFIIVVKIVFFYSKHSRAIIFLVSCFFEKHCILKRKKSNYFWCFWIHFRLLTIKKQAPSITAFIRTSKSMGKLMPKKSASVNISRAIPDHCFEILPTSSPFIVTIYNFQKCKKRSNSLSQLIFAFSLVFTLNSTSPHRENVHSGPSIRRTVSPFWFLMAKLG